MKLTDLLEVNFRGISGHQSALNHPCVNNSKMNQRRSQIRCRANSRSNVLNIWSFHATPHLCFSQCDVTMGGGTSTEPRGDTIYLQWYPTCHTCHHNTSRQILFFLHFLLSFRSQSHVQSLLPACGNVLHVVLPYCLYVWTSVRRTSH